MRSAIRLTRDGETHFYVAPTAVEIATFLDYEFCDLVNEPFFDGLFEEVAVVDLATWTCVETKFERVA